VSTTGASGTSDDDRGRVAAATLVAGWVQPGTTIGLGSGRATRAVIAALGARWPDGVPLRAVVASRSSDAAAREVGIEVVSLTADVRLELVIDGADEVDPSLALIKGGGGALLHEKVLTEAGGGLVVVVEAHKRVPRLGVGFPLPIEVVRFGWEVTAARVAELLGPPALRADATGEPFVTEEGHLLLDAPLGPGVDLRALDRALAALPGVVEHGLFLDQARTVVFGHADGSVEELRAEGWRPPGQG
jgi:ribose 5-phosphate isomerase A